MWLVHDKLTGDSVTVHDKLTGDSDWCMTSLLTGVTGAWQIGWQETNTTNFKAGLWVQLIIDHNTLVGVGLNIARQIDRKKN